MTRIGLFGGGALSAAESPSVLATMIRVEKAQTPLDLFTADRPPGERDDLATEIGGALILIALSTRTREQLSRPGQQTIREESESVPLASPGHVARAAFGLWEFGETLAIAAGRVLVVFACYFGVMGVVQGVPLSGELIDQVTNQTLGIVSLVVQLTRSV
jgi:hypothetical protein